MGFLLAKICVLTIWLEKSFIKIGLLIRFDAENWNKWVIWNFWLKDGGFQTK